MATYVNDLRLKEIATGDEAGTWGTSTNTNLELIAEAFSFGTEAITTNADTHTTTIADGSTDPGRSMFLKYTGTLDSACTITIGPNTVSKLWLIENATSGSQNIIISQGSGANITIANGQTKAIYSDGGGSGAAMVDAFQDLSIPDLFIDDDLTFTSDSAVITFGADGDTTLTHTDGSGLTLNSTNKIMFNDASQFIQGSSATVLSLGATDEIDLTATLIDINGAVDMASTLAIADNITQSGGDYIYSGGINFDIKHTGGGQNIVFSTTPSGGSTAEVLRITSTGVLAKETGDFTLDVAGDIILDADGADIKLLNGGTHWGSLYTNATPNNLYLQNMVSDGDIYLSGSDGGSAINALVLDMSAAGAATFNAGITASNAGVIKASRSDNARSILVFNDNSNATIESDTDPLLIKSANDLTLDAVADIVFDADGGDFNFKDGGTTLLSLSNAGSNNVQLSTSISDGDLLIKGNDGGSIITALTLDMSDGGTAIFGSWLKMADSNRIVFGAGSDLSIYSDGTDGKILVDGNLDFDVSGNIKLDADDAGEIRILDGGTQYAAIKKDGNNALFQSIVADGDFIIQGIDGSSFISAVTFDMSAAGAATFNSTCNATGYIFSNDSDTGVIRGDTNQINLRTGGADNFILTSTQLTIPKGTASAPGLAFTGDDNTGINAVNADNLGFTVGGSQKAFLSATQFNVTGNGVFSGSISKGSGSFKIDHPLPAKTDTHHLVHSFVEAPQADNIYRGSVDLVGGSATVNIDTAAGMTDGTFVLLNTNVQCFTSNESGWTAIKGSVSGNTLTITAQDNSCTDTISWMVVGERHDQHMKDTEWTDSDGKVIVEPEKT